MSELTEKLFDHKWENPTVPEMKMLRNEAGNRIEDMEKAISIWVREKVDEPMEFADDEEAVEWFIEYSDALDKGTDKEFLAKTPKDRKMEKIAATLGVSIEDLKAHPNFDEIMDI